MEEEKEEDVMRKIIERNGGGNEKMISEKERVRGRVDVLKKKKEEIEEI